jgi:ferrous iron transport protein B
MATTVEKPPPKRGNPVVALVGNPNTGKTTLFNALAGMRQRVGNYPGVTVETKKGRLSYHGRAFDLIDLPGTYSLAPRSPDEMVAVDLLLGQQEGAARPDVVVSIVDASNLERNLYLTTQALELGVPVVVALNMIDVAEGQGVRIDAARLSKQLGVPVVPIQANKGRGLDQLKEAIARTCPSSVVCGPSPRATGHGPRATDDEPSAKRPSFPVAFEREVAALQEAVGGEVAPFLVRRLLLDVGGYTERRLAERHGAPVAALVPAARQRLTQAGCPVPGVEARTRYGWIRDVTAGCVQRPDQRPVTWTDRLDRLLTHKVWGTLIFLALMFVVFQSIFTWADPLMKLIGSGKDALQDALRDWLPPGPLTSLLADGVVAGVGSVLVFLPQIVILFAFIALLEDCGYMARAAFLMDKLMARCGLSGKSFIPMLSSVACAVPGIMATRVIEDRRDRLATILVAPLMSCSARLPVYILLIGTFLPVRDRQHLDGYPWWVPGLVMFAMYAIGLVVAPLVALVLKRTLLRGETPVFVMEMPLYKWPSPRTVLRRITDSAWAFLYRAGTLILASMVVVWALLYFPYTDAQGNSYEEHVARAEQDVKGPREERDQLEKRIAGPKKELEALAEKRSFQQDHAADARRAELEAAVKPVAEQIEELDGQVAPLEERINRLQAEWKGRSLLGRLGHAIEPAVRPLGWDWKIGTAALASFPAREVVVGTLGIIYSQGKVESDEIREAQNPGETKLGVALKSATWDDDPGRKVFSVPAALSLMVFFALCCQCASTLAVIRRETRSWGWPLFTFTYMTVLAYVGALLVYQIGSRIG